MGNKQSKASRSSSSNSSSSSSLSPPPYSEKEEKKEKKEKTTSPSPPSSSSSTSNSKPTPKREPLEEIKRCKRCRRRFMESQMNNPLVDTRCNRYHTGVLKTRREMLTTRNRNETITKTIGASNDYFEKLAWTCCFASCLMSENGGYLNANGCQKYDGKHESA